MKLTILNLTKDSLSIGITSRTKGQDHVVLLPSATTTLSQVRSRNLKLTITPADPKVDANNKNWSNLANAHPVNFMKDVPYYSIHAADHFPLQVYRCRVCS
jgi:hypothetical protein